MELSPLARKVLTSTILLFSIWWVTVLHGRLKIVETLSRTEESVFYLPKSDWIRPMLLGHEAFLADLVWIRTLGYFADELFGMKKFSYLEDLISFSVDLDPRFEKIYMWAGAVLMYRGGSISRDKIEASTRILEKGWRYIQNEAVGWKHDPQYWMIPQMIGFNYAIELKDKKRGAPYIAATARIPGSPDIYKTWAATLYKRAGEWEEGSKVLESMLAIETLQSQLESVKDESIKQKIRDRLTLYYAKIYGKEAAIERIRDFETRLGEFLIEWRGALPYVSFPLFMLLRSSKDEWQNIEVSDTWSNIFPLLISNS